MPIVYLTMKNSVMMRPKHLLGWITITLCVLAASFYGGMGPTDGGLLAQEKAAAPAAPVKAEKTAPSTAAPKDAWKETVPAPPADAQKQDIRDMGKEKAAPKAPRLPVPVEKKAPAKKADVSAKKTVVPVEDAKPGVAEVKKKDDAPAARAVEERVAPTRTEPFFIAVIPSEPGTPALEGWRESFTFGDIAKWARPHGLKPHRNAEPLVDGAARFVSRFGSSVKIDGLDRNRRYHLWIDFVTYDALGANDINARLEVLADREKIGDFNFGDVTRRNNPARLELPYHLTMDGKVDILFREYSQEGGLWGVWDLIVTDAPELPRTLVARKKTPAGIEEKGRIIELLPAGAEKKKKGADIALRKKKVPPADRAKTAGRKADSKIAKTDTLPGDKKTVSPDKKEVPKRTGPVHVRPEEYALKEKVIETGKGGGKIVNIGDAGAMETSDTRDKKPLDIVQVIPGPGNKVGPRGPVMVFLNDRVYVPSIPDSIEVHEDGTPVPGTVTILPNSSGCAILNYVPLKEFKKGSDIKISIKRGLKDDGGNPMKKDTKFNVTAGVATEGEFLHNLGFEKGTKGLVIQGDGAVITPPRGMEAPEGKHIAALSTGTIITRKSPLMNTTSMLTCGPVNERVTEVSFKYNFASAEFNAHVGSMFDDSVLLILSGANDNKVFMVDSVNIAGPQEKSLPYDFFPGFPDAGTFNGITGWKEFRVKDLDIKGPVTMTFILSDVGDREFSSMLFVDDIRLKTAKDK